MIDTRLFSQDPESGITRYFHFDEETGDVVIETQQSLAPLMELAKDSKAGIDERASWKGDMHHVGIVPMPIFMEITRKYPDPEEQEKHLRAFLNDPAFANFRTRPGRV